MSFPSFCPGRTQTIPFTTFAGPRLSLPPHLQLPSYFFLHIFRTQAIHSVSPHLQDRGYSSAAQPRLHLFCSFYDRFLACYCLCHVRQFCQSSLPLLLLLILQGPGYSQADIAMEHKDKAITFTVTLPGQLPFKGGVVFDTTTHGTVRQCN